ITRGLFEALFGDTVENLGVNGVQNPYETDTKTWSLFGQVEYDLTEQLAVIGGFRWIDEKKSHVYNNNLMWYQDTSTSGIDPNAMVIAPALAGLPYFNKRSDSNWSARVQVNFRPVENLLTYASWNRGVKSGGFNA